MPASYLFFYSASEAGLAGPSLGAAREARASRLLGWATSAWLRVRGEVTITGHEDDAEAPVDPTLGRRRAEALRDALVSRGVDASVSRVVDAGAAQPLLPKPSGVAEEQNRFAEVRVEEAARSCIREAP